MFDIDKWSEILETLLRNKTRSLLTAFGIFWGIFMLVLLMGGTQGMKGMLTRNFEGFAQNTYMLMAGSTTKPYDGYQVGRKWELDNSDIEVIRHRIDGIGELSPIIAMWGSECKYQDHSSSGTAKGVLPSYSNIENPKLTAGRYIEQSDLENYRKVCVIGKKIAQDLFPEGENPVGRFISINGIYFHVIGVSGINNKMGLGGSASESVICPFTTMQRLCNRGTKIDMLTLTADNTHTITDLQPQIEKIIRERHHIHPDDSRAFFGLNLEAMFQMMQSLFDAVNILVWLIGIGTLLSGAIGVSNIMMVTVKERTTEIGIRRAIGARPSSILWQILSESIILTILAGLGGIVVAVLALAGIESACNSDPLAAPVNFQISFWLAIGSALALSLLGGLAGIAPALRALAIKPIEALTDE